MVANSFLFEDDDGNELRWISGEYVCAHGIEPGVATVDAVPPAKKADGTPGKTPGPNGDLAMACNGTVLTLLNCRLLPPDPDRGGRGETIWRCSILDRRWRWKYADPVTLNVNLRDDAGRLLDEEDQPLADGARAWRSPTWIISYLLEALGESDSGGSNHGDFEIENGIDTDTEGQLIYPEVELDYENPAEALQDLCSDLGLRIIFDPPEDRVVIRVVGSGATDLPNNALQKIKESDVTPEHKPRPETILVVGGLDHYEDDWTLEMAVQDRDGVWRTLDDAGLSWAAEVEAARASVENITDEEARAAAARTLWRTYRLADGQTLRTVNGTDCTADRDDLLPIMDKRLTQGDDGETSPAIVKGIYAKKETGENTPDGTQYAGEFELDLAKGMVTFADDVYQVSTNTGKREAATITLRCAVTGPHFNEHAEETGVRYTYSAHTGFDDGYGTLVVKDDDIWLAYIDGEEDDYTNGESAEWQASRRAQYELYKLQAAERTTYVLAGLHRISPDGAIHQVGWRFDDGGAVTNVSINGEWDVRMPDFPGREEERQALSGSLRNKPSSRAQQRSNAKTPRATGRPRTEEESRWVIVRNDTGVGLLEWDVVAVAWDSTAECYLATIPDSDTAACALVGPDVIPDGQKGRATLLDGWAIVSSDATPAAGDVLSASAGHNYLVEGYGVANFRALGPKEAWGDYWRVRVRPFDDALLLELLSSGNAIWRGDPSGAQAQNARLTVSTRRPDGSLANFSGGGAAFFLADQYDGDATLDIDNAAFSSGVASLRVGNEAFSDTSVTGGGSVNWGTPIASASWDGAILSDEGTPLSIIALGGELSVTGGGALFDGSDDAWVVPTYWDPFSGDPIPWGDAITASVSPAQTVVAAEFRAATPYSSGGAPYLLVRRTAETSPGHRSVMFETPPVGSPEWSLASPLYIASESLVGTCTSVDILALTGHPGGGQRVYQARLYGPAES